MVSTTGRDLIRVGYWTALTKGNRKDNLSRGDVFYIAGVKSLPTSKTDPYAQRIYMMAVLGYDLIGDNPEKKLYIVDPRQLYILPAEEAMAWQDKMEAKSAVMEAAGATLN